jgi:hypothetical protein
MALGPLFSDAVLTPEQREARRLAANTLPQGTSIVGPTADGDPLAFGTGNTFNVGQGQEVRVVDAGGNVIFSGAGTEGANRAVAVAQSLSDELGGNANFKIQTGERTINPDGSVGGTRYIDVARAAPMQSGLGFLADNVLPFAASFIPGIGPIAGAALGSAVSSGLQGRDLQDALMRAAIAGGTAYAGGQLFGPASPTTTAPMTGVNADLIPNALQGLNFGSLTSAAIPAGVGGAAGNIIVNATRAVTPSLVGSTLGGVLGSAVASQIAAPNQSNVVDGVDQDTGEIVVSKYRPINPPGGFDPIAVLQGPGLGSALAGVPELTDLAMDPTLSGPAEEDIVVTGNKTVPATVIPDVLAGLGPLLPTLGIPQVPTPDPALTENKFDFNDVLGTGLTLPQLVSIGGIGADLLGNLLGGGSGGAGTPYVSPFGTGVGFARGQDMRANPNITDYERYGFGPEAMFFRPEYSGLVSGGTAPTQAQPAMAINPVYQPLI